MLKSDGVVSQGCVCGSLCALCYFKPSVRDLPKLKQRALEGTGEVMRQAPAQAFWGGFNVEAFLATTRQKIKAQSEEFPKAKNKEICEKRSRELSKILKRMHHKATVSTMMCAAYSGRRSSSDWNPRSEVGRCIFPGSRKVTTPTRRDKNQLYETEISFQCPRLDVS